MDKSMKRRSHSLDNENVLRTVSKNTLKKRRQRANQKKDPERLAAAREKDSARKKESRATKKKFLEKYPCLQEKEREKNKLRMRRIRQNKQSIETIESTREIASKKRETRKRRRNRTHELKLETKMSKIKRQKEVTRVQAFRLRIKLKSSSTTSTVSQESTPFSSVTTEKRAVRKIKKSLPHTPIKRAKVLEKLLQSPRSKTILVQKGIVMGEEMKSRMKMSSSILKSLKEKLDDVTHTGGITATKRAAAKILHAVVNGNGKWRMRSKVFQEIKLRRQQKKSNRADWWKPLTRTRRKDIISATVKERVKTFYLSPQISREIPDKRAAIKIKQGTKVVLVERHEMTMTLRDAHRRYTRQYPRDKVGLTSFVKQRPRQVKIVSETNRRTCLCQICCNAALKGEALKKFTSVECSEQLHLVLTSKHDVVDATVCEYSTEYPQANCISRQCDSCGPAKLDVRYCDILERSDQEIQWNKWEYVNVKKREDTTKRVISCVTKTTSLYEFMEEYKSDLVNLPGHIFRADWQQKQLKTCIDNLAEGEAVLCMDYAESYQCRFQGEVQSAFFDQNQVTIHPMMSYYRQASKEDGDQQSVLVKHAIIGITDDHQKDANGVKAFENAALEIIGTEISTTLTKVHEFTDGCSAQYKGRKSFYDLSKKVQPEIVRNFYETSHGKSVCDGLGAIVKASCYQAVVSRNEIICNAEDLFGFCQKKLQISSRSMTSPDGSSYISKRQFVYIKQDDVERTRPESKTLIGTRKIHSVKTLPDDLCLDVRPLSCYCKTCRLESAEEDCVNKAYVSPWITRRIELTKQSRKGTGMITPTMTR